MSNMKSIILKNILNVTGGVLVAALVGCGGGGGSAGTPSSGIGTNPTITTTTPVVITPTGVVTPTSTVTVAVAADFIFQLDKQALSTSGGDAALLTVLAVDSNRNVVANVPVSVAVDAGAVFSSLVVGTATNATGQYTGNITIGGNKSNRTINAKIVVSGIEKTASILVVGSQITVTPVPATPAPGQVVSINLTSLDSAGASVASVPISLSGSSGVLGTSTTDLSGQKIATFTAPLTPGSYSIVAAGLGVSTTKVIQVISPAGGGFPDAVGIVSSASLSPQPSSIPPNQSGATTSRAKLTARFLTPANAGLQNLRVRFEILQPGLGSGESVSTGGSTVYSDVSGIAESEYIAGTRSSPTNGVLLRACYKASDFSSALDCPNSVTTTFTVAGTPLSISIGDDNLLEKGLGNIAYLKKFLIQVNDASGVAVKDAIVSVSVDITHYGKGRFSGSYPNGSVPPTILDPSLASVATSTNTFVVRPSEIISPSFVSGGTGTFLNVWCINEDKNRNGALDTGEDTNTDGILTPRKAEVIVSYASGNTTNANGQMLVQVTYGQNVGGWLSYTLRATTRVAGSEGDASKSYITDVLQADVPNGSFLTPPYGFGSCSVRN